MTAAPRVSVVMPAYNASRTIAEAIRSVLAQSCAELELIVCDDASTDDTGAVAAAAADRRTRILRLARNAGPGAARDCAIDAANGHWVAVIDADDAWAPDRLERLMGAAVPGEDRMVFDDILMCHDGRRGLVPWRRLRGDDAFGGGGPGARDITTESYVLDERLLIKPIIPLRAIRAHGVRHGPRRFAEDAGFFLRLAAHGLRLRYLPEPLYLYRITPGSATAEAHGGPAMRECLQECAAYDGFGDAVRRALAAKIGQVADHEEIRRLARHLRRLELPSAARTLAKRPRILGRLPALAWRRLSYELHRALHGGRR